MMVEGEIYQASPCQRYRILLVGKDVVRYWSEADEAVRESSLIQWELDIEWDRVVLTEGGR